MGDIWNTILKKRNSIEKDDNLPQLPLSEFSKRSLAIEIHGELLQRNIWFCSNDEMVKRIKTDVPNAVCYTSDELKHLLSLKPTPEDIRKLHLVKEQLNNSKIMHSTILHGD